MEQKVATCELLISSNAASELLLVLTLAGYLVEQWSEVRHVCLSQVREHQKTVSRTIVTGNLSRNCSNNAEH